MHLTRLISELLVLLLIVPAIFSEVLKCNLPRNFSLDAYENVKVEFYNPTMEIRYDDSDIRFYGYPQRKFITIRSKNVLINLKSTCRNIFSPGRIASDPVNFTYILDEEITGTGQRTPIDNTTYSIFNCRLILLPSKEEKTSEPILLRNQIRRLAESCLELNICTKFSKVKRWQFIENSSNGQVCFLPGLPGSLADVIAQNPYETTANLDHFQDIVNTVVDVTLKDVIGQMNFADGTMSIPNVIYEFSTGSSIFKTNGRLEATGGTFQNLTTLYRSANVDIIRSGNKLIASCGIGLSVAKIHFDKYTLKYGIVRATGQIDGGIDGITLEAAVSVDYSKEICITKIDKIQVSEFGKVTVSTTGLWRLNSLLSSIVNIVTKFWKVNIVKMIENKLMEVAEEQVLKFDCEKYRPQVQNRTR